MQITLVWSFPYAYGYLTHLGDPKIPILGTCLRCFNGRVCDPHRTWALSDDLISILIGCLG